MLCWGLRWWLSISKEPCKAGDTGDAGSIPQSGKSLGGGQPTPDSCPENPTDRRAWWATVHSVTRSQTRLKRLSTCTDVSCLASTQCLEPACDHFYCHCPFCFSSCEKQPVNPSSYHCFIQQRRLSLSKEFSEDRSRL